MSARSVSLLLLLQCSALELGAGLQVAPQDCSVAELEALVSTFESADRRLVMMSPDNDTLAKQEELVANGAFGKLECAMHPENHPRQHTLGSELAAYLAASNPANRAAIGAIPGVLGQLATLVNYTVHYQYMDDVVVQEAENAAEAIAILSKADAHNSAVLAQTSAASDLATMLEREDGVMTPKAFMWAGAALGNLMAKFDNPAASSYAQQVQTAMAERPNFMHRLMHLARVGTVQESTPPYMMPGRAARTEEARRYPQIYGWGVMQAIKNLALSPEGHAQLIAEPDAHELFCRLSMSPDPMEKMNAAVIVAIAAWGCDGANNFAARDEPDAGEAASKTAAPENVTANTVIAKKAAPKKKAAEKTKASEKKAAEKKQRAAEKKAAPKKEAAEKTEASEKKAAEMKQRAAEKKAAKKEAAAKKAASKTAA